MINCSDNSYYIYYTDSSTGAIAIPISKSALDQTTLDITLVGKTRLEYGEVFNANLLHLVEHFSCPADALNLDSPDLDETYQNLLYNPVIGQLWYNNTKKRLYMCTERRVLTPIAAEPVWLPISSMGDVAGNSGVMFNGEVLPLPFGADGYEYTQEECVWLVSPLFTESVNTIIGMDVTTNENRVITAQYITASGTVAGSVSYFIFGVKNKTMPAKVTV